MDAAQLNLSFTKIVSLIDGIAGVAQAQIGDLVGQSSLLTTVSTLDPIKVYFPVSEREYLDYVRENPMQRNAPRNTVWRWRWFWPTARFIRTKAQFRLPTARWM